MDEFFRRMAEELAPLVAQHMGAPASWIDQKDSPLGRNRHCAAVKRMVAEGKDGAAIVGRRCLLTPAALKDEMQRRMIHPKPPVKADPPVPKSEEDVMCDELRARVRSAGGY